MFDDLEDDEFDFHGYCIRKSTLKAYLKCVPLSRKLTTHLFRLHLLISRMRPLVLGCTSTRETFGRRRTTSRLRWPPQR